MCSKFAAKPGKQKPSGFPHEFPSPRTDPWDERYIHVHEWWIFRYIIYVPYMDPMGMMVGIFLTSLVILLLMAEIR